MRLICDANIGTIIAEALVAAGHDIVRAIHVVPDAPDEVVLAYAVADDRTLITCDRDFGELVFKRGAIPPPAIVYIRFEPDDVVDIVPRLLPVLDFRVLNGQMAVVGDQAIRRTPFPKRSRNDG